MNTMTRHKEKNRNRGQKDNLEQNYSANRKALVKSLRGSLAWIDYSVDQYLAEKYAEIERENRL